MLDAHARITLNVERMFDQFALAPRLPERRGPDRSRAAGGAESVTQASRPDREVRAAASSPARETHRDTPCMRACPRALVETHT